MNHSAVQSMFEWTTWHSKCSYGILPVRTDLLVSPQHITDTLLQPLLLLISQMPPHYKMPENGRSMSTTKCSSGMVTIYRWYSLPIKLSDYLSFSWWSWWRWYNVKFIPNNYISTDYLHGNPFAKMRFVALCGWWQWDLIEENPKKRQVSDTELDEFCHQNNFIGWYAFTYWFDVHLMVLNKPYSSCSVCTLSIVS